MISTYSLKNDGNISITKHFQVKELKCKDGSDLIIINSDIIEKAETIRSGYGITKAIVTSGYRTTTYNKKIGGSTNSQHCKGNAVDICFYINGKVADHKYIACLAQDLGFKGIGFINNKTIHLDMRSGNYRGDERKGYSNNVSNDFYSYFNLTKEQVNEYFGIKDDTSKNIEIKPSEEQTNINDKIDEDKTNKPYAPCKCQKKVYSNNKENVFIKILDLIVKMIKK